MNRGDDLGFRELPYVQFVNREHTLDGKDLGSDIFQRDFWGDALEQDEGCTTDWVGRVKTAPRMRGKDSPRGKAEWKMIAVMTKLIIGSQ